MRLRTTAPNASTKNGVWKYQRFLAGTQTISGFNQTGNRSAWSYGEESSYCLDEQPLKSFPLSRKPEVKPAGYCKHTRTFTNLIQEDVRELQRDGAYDNVWTWTGNAYLWDRGITNQSSLDNKLTAIATIDTLEWDVWSGEAYRSLKPSFNEDGLNLLSEIVELREVHDLVTQGRRVIANERRGKSQSTLRRLNEAYLAYALGFQQLTSLATRIYEKLLQIPAALQRLKREKSKVQRRHFTRLVDIMATPAPSVVLTDYTASSPNYRVTRYFNFVQRPVYHATLIFRYDLDGLSDFGLQLRGYLEGLGITDPFSILWNAIPFSFVVDWFADVGRWVSQFTRVDAIPIVELGFNDSVKYEYVSSLRCKDQFLSNEQVLATRTTKYYERRREPPCTYDPLQLNIPSIGQVLTGASLVYAIFGTDKEFKKR